MPSLNQKIKVLLRIKNGLKDEGRKMRREGVEDKASTKGVEMGRYNDTQSWVNCFVSHVSLSKHYMTIKTKEAFISTYALLYDYKL